MVSKRVIHYNYSDSGGAAKVAKTLSEAQKEILGYRTSFVHKIDGDLWKNPFQDLNSSATSFFDQIVVKKKDFKPMFSLYRGKFSKSEILTRGEILNDSIIHLHWITGWFDPLEFDNKVYKKIVWTLHDFEPLTGGCHNSLTCDNFLKNCENCPAIKKVFSRTVINTKLRKNYTLESLKNLEIVVPSRWMYKKIETMELLKYKNVEVIPNPIDKNFFQDFSKRHMRDKYNVSYDTFVIGFMSQRINNSLKNFDMLIKIVSKVKFGKPRKILIYAIGESKLQKFNTKGVEVRITGSITNPTFLAEQISLLDVMVSLSGSETFGLSIAEASALGVPGLVLKGTATEEILLESNGGLVAKSEHELVQILRIMTDDSDLLRNLGKNGHKYAREQLSIESILKKYDYLYLNSNL
jgi:glycosyltransferase involved in cell wall biosynthesis